MSSVQKKKRSRVALKPKLGTTSLELAPSMQSPLNTAFSTVPRTIRSRIAKATKPQKAKSRKTEDVSNQPVARSNSGKVALGPWGGAFGSQDSISADETVLYIDRAGSTHMELDETQETTGDAIVPKGHRKGTILATSPAALVVPPPPDEETMKRHSRELATLQQKPIVAHWGRSACGKQANKGRAKTRIGFINQPKRGL